MKRADTISFLTFRTASFLESKPPINHPEYLFYLLFLASNYFSLFAKIIHWGDFNNLKT